MMKYSQLLEELMQDIKDEILLFKKSDVKAINDLINQINRRKDERI